MKRSARYDVMVSWCHGVGVTGYRGIVASWCLGVIVSLAHIDHIEPRWGSHFQSARYQYCLLK